MAEALFPSRAKAQEAIAAGLVAIDGRVVQKPAARVPAGSALSAASLYPWVSRGGVKLEAGLDQFGLDPAGRLCLDIGASTGGFTDVLLSRGARHIYAVDTGHGQLHPRLVGDARVTDWSGTDARGLTPDRFPEPPSLIVCDASFISLRLVLPPVLRLAAPGAALLALVKPQFEVGPAGVRKGIVRDAALQNDACQRISEVVAALGWTVLGLMPSPITGSDGNTEFLLGAQIS